MPILRSQKRPFKPARVLKKTYEGPAKGMNTLLRENELGDNQARSLENMILEGKGIATPKPGSATYYTASASGKIRGLFSHDDDLLSVSDLGVLAKKNGLSSTEITGASWASGVKVRSTQLQGKTYIVQSGKPLTVFDGSALLSYITLSSPTNLMATRLSGVTGTYTWSWRLSAFTDVGRTLPSTPVTLSGLPEYLSENPVRITWTAPSSASGLIKGYEVYGRLQGNETRLTGLQAETTSWIDDGTLLPSNIAFMPDFNETGGPSAKLVTKSAGKVILANIANFPSRVMWSGADINVGKFHWTKGGGYIDVSADDGQEITAIKEVSENRIVVWKNRSVYQMQLNYNNDLGIVEAQVQKISDAVGCISADTVTTAENDTLFVGERPGGGIALNSLGYEANILASVLRTAEVSPQLRPTLRSINRMRRNDMFAVFFDQKYWWFYPVGSTTMRVAIYDYERRAFSVGTVPNNPSVGMVYFDADETPHMVLGSGSDGTVYEVSSGFTNDLGQDFSWLFASKKEDFKLPFQLKTLLKAFFHISNISGGVVNVEILAENADGETNTISNFSIEAADRGRKAGFGSFAFGYLKRWGSSEQASKTNFGSSDVRRYVDLNEPSIVSCQIKISGTGTQAKIVGMELQARQEVAPASSWRVE